MGANYKEELVGVFGHPVAENPTVVMQKAAFEAFNLNWRYLTIEVLPKDLEAAMSGLRAMNMRGINLTIPHKVEVLKYLDEVSPEAELMGAVNTVVRHEGPIDRGKHRWKRVLCDRSRRMVKWIRAVKRWLCWGPAGRRGAITVELALAGAEQITIVNRNTERGLALVDLLNSKTPTAALFIPWPGTYSIPEDIDIVINATSVGLPPNGSEKPDVAYDSLLPGMCVCDVIPAPTTPFLAEAKSRGASLLDGLGMLVYQGAIGFKIWTGEDAPVSVMHESAIPRAAMMIL